MENKKMIIEVYKFDKDKRHELVSTHKLKFGNGDTVTFDYTLNVNDERSFLGRLFNTPFKIERTFFIKHGG